MVLEEVVDVGVSGLRREVDGGLEGSGGGGNGRGWWRVETIVLVREDVARDCLGWQWCASGAS